MSTLIEKHIVELLQERNENAIALLYDNYGDTLLGVANKVVRNQELAQDVLQESFVKIWKKGDSYDPSKAKLFTWLFIGAAATYKLPDPLVYFCRNGIPSR